MKKQNVNWITGCFIDKINYYFMVLELLNNLLIRCSPGNSIKPTCCLLFLKDFKEHVIFYALVFADDCLSYSNSNNNLDAHYFKCIFLVKGRGNWISIPFFFYYTLHTHILRSFKDSKYLGVTIMHFDLGYQIDYTVC